MWGQWYNMRGEALRFRSDRRQLPPTLTEAGTSLMRHLTDRVRVLIANKPRAYREVITETLRALRPGVEFALVEPESLEETIPILRPHMVVCNEASAAVRSEVPVWVELYAGHGSRSVVSISGKSSVVEDMQLSDLLSIVDQTEVLAQPG